MKRTIRHILITGSIILMSGFLVNAMSVKKDKKNIYEQAEELRSGETTTLEDTEDSPLKESFFNNYKVYAIDLPEKLDFAGERVPIEDPDVYERLDREFLVNTYWQSNGMLYIKRANKYFPIIEPILKRNNIPDDFKYLALIESGLTNAVSPAGASGFWQFMKSAAKEYGLEVGDQVDERYHLEKATQAACDYLNAAKRSTGSWTMAAAAYNAGVAGMNRQANLQETNNYYDLWLNNETSRYVFRILAVKEIMKNPKKYGFIFDKRHLYNELPTYSVMIDSSITNLISFAKQYNITYKDLKIYNPWLRDRKLENKDGKTYYIKIPKK
ncbi:transglycosylase SLT domain protein [Capnocytophaga sp. oral taxon 332 str. F0381]|uniref:lytic transglycosylase domain-containing protein n=1 Tax=Capnocytophaga sp. oral taxon 332 TaxID=712213 RepID=UPI0002A33F0A|nr:lytic transglycosylase domain-containing protein [Capnocytophaga sp. oral taxon 332]EKY05961.1 transglycosylase SLT domain protein [Capnocytophaga sp. oral taxon 332 str. F0381]